MSTRIPSRKAATVGHRLFRVAAEYIGARGFSVPEGPIAIEPETSVGDIVVASCPYGGVISGCGSTVWSLIGDYTNSYGYINRLWYGVMSADFASTPPYVSGVQFGPGIIATWRGPTSAVKLAQTEALGPDVPFPSVPAPHSTAVGRVVFVHDRNVGDATAPLGYRKLTDGVYVDTTFSTVMADQLSGMPTGAAVVTMTGFPANSYIKSGFLVELRKAV